MKTEYHQEIKDLFSQYYEPANPKMTNAEAITLDGLWEEVTNILPVEWVTKADVYAVLVELNYKAYQEQTAITINKKELHSYTLKYYVTRKITY